MTEKQLQLMIWLRIHKFRANYLGASHDGHVAANLARKGYVVITRGQGTYSIEMTPAGRVALDALRPEVGA